MSEKEHSVDFLMIKLLHVYATKIFHQLSHVNLHPGQMPMLDQTVYGDGVPAANGKSSSDLPGG